MEAAQQLESEGISAEVVDLQTLDADDLDLAAIGESLQKTHIVDQIAQAIRAAARRSH